MIDNGADLNLKGIKLVKWMKPNEGTVQNVRWLILFLNKMKERSWIVLNPTKPQTREQSLGVVSRLTAQVWKKPVREESITF